MVERVYGIVKFFIDDKGYGFIAPVDGGKDIFVHRSGLVSGLRELKSDQKVSYRVEQSDRPRGDGKMAVEVQLES